MHLNMLRALSLTIFIWAERRAVARPITRHGSSLLAPGTGAHPPYSVSSARAWDRSAEEGS